MRKWIALILTTLLLLAAMGAAADTDKPQTGIAVAAPADEVSTVAMHEMPDPDSAVLMEYYQGAVFEVLSLEKSGMVRVQCGMSGASIIGYMKEGDLRYGAQALRDLPPSTMLIEILKDVEVHAYPDVLSQTRFTLSQGDRFHAISRNADGWVQIEVGDLLVQRTGEWESGGASYDGGFAQMIPGRGMGSFLVGPSKWMVVPLESELSYAEAHVRAIELMLESETVRSKLPDKLFTREALEGFRADLRLYAYASGKIEWEICIESENGAEYSFNIYMSPAGELIDIQTGNG